MFRNLVTATLLFVLATPAWADFQKGWSAYYRGDYATALNELRPVAAGGHPAAQVNLGIMYEEGQGVQQNLAEALRWYRQAALGGYAKGQLRLGTLYQAGKGVPQDTAEAIKWYRMAAGRRDTEAMMILGKVYRDGRGLPADPVRALMWYHLAVAYLPEGRFRNGVVAERDALAATLTETQRTEARHLARNWKPTT